MEKTKNIPKIRFKGYNNEWEKDTIDSLGTITTGTTPSTSIRTYYNGNRLFASPADIYGQRLLYRTAKTLSDEGFKVARQASAGDSLFVCIGATIGKIIQINQDTAFNQQINAVSPTEKFDKNFVYSLLNSNSSKIVSKNSAQTMPILNKSEFSKKEVFLTLNYEEQKQIGSLFKNLDEKLEIEREKHEKLVNFKKAMLENVFPKEGEKRPKIRFGGYNDDWEDYSIERLPGFKSFDKGNGLTKDDLLKNDKYNKAILYGHIFTEYGNYLSEVKFSTKKFSDKYTFSEIGDLIIPASSTTSDNSIARGLAVNIPNVIYGGDINVIRFNNDITNVFLAYYMDNNFLKNKIFEVVQGTTIHHLYLNNIKDISVSIPSIEEQKLIGSFFKNLDEKIQVSEEKITKIENFKKAMMDGLFV